MSDPVEIASKKATASASADGGGRATVRLPRVPRSSFGWKTTLDALIGQLLTP